MVNDGEEWPPRSPLKALLSSPSGRKMYREHQDLGLSTSPNKLLGSPSLLEKLRAARANRDHEILPQVDGAADEDDDEETLQLKLQAIEARLKLKRLQKAKDVGKLRPQSSADTINQAGAPSSNIEVKLSPTRKPSASAVQKSPSRVLLGIDKGLNAEDVSLRRARPVHASPTRDRVHHVESRLLRPPASTSSSAASIPGPAKSFSERMAEMRERERQRQESQAAMQNARASRFKFDKKEVERYHTAANHSTNSPPRTATRSSQNGPESDREDTNAAKVKQPKYASSMPSMRSTSPTKNPKPVINKPTRTCASDGNKGDPSLFEGFSRTHLSTRILPHTFLKRTLPEGQFTVYTVPRLLKEVVSPAYSLPDEVVDYVVFGIIATKSLPLNHKPRTADTNSVSSAEWEKKWNDGSANRQKFIVLKLTDLKWTIDLYLFDTAVPKYHRLTPGTLLAVLNPGIMPPKKGKEDTGAFSLALHDGEDRILEIGTAKHLGYCSAKKKDGSLCGDWVDASKTEICEYHLNAQLNKVRSKRSGINSMSGWGDEPKEKSTNVRQGYDAYSQSLYYAVGGSAPKKPIEERWSFAPTLNPNLSTAKLLDMAPGDDPFIAEGAMLERDKQDRLRKRMAAMQKEHEIAKRLGNLGANAGGEYMRQRTGGQSMGNTQTTTTTGSRITKADIFTERPGESKKRAADSVRLSPVKKKTRFVTDRGIKEAGRESLGSGNLPSVVSSSRRAADDDDSDLDIV